MTEEIKNNNKLIAEFMGYKADPYFYIPNHSVLVRVPYTHEHETQEHFTAEELKYHSSWDWLMPVFQKIIKHNQFACIDDTPVGEWRLIKSISSLSLGCTIKEAYDKAIEFINQFNKEKKND